MLQHLQTRLGRLPTPLAGLALAIASLGWCLENALPFDGAAKQSGALIAALLLAPLTLKFIRFPRLLWQDLSHPVVGSVVPTLAMGWMVVSHALGRLFPAAGVVLWLLAIGLHVLFLLSFIFHRLRDFNLQQLVPGWFVPPVGLIVADVAVPGHDWLPLATLILDFGLICYAVMLPLMLFRLIFGQTVPTAAQPTIAILAAPASLSLAGYLTVNQQPTILLVGLLAGIALLMTALIYVSFLSLLRLPFNPGYAAFTFPMVIGATALFKLAHQCQLWGLDSEQLSWILTLAHLELLVATLVVSYVALRYLCHYAPCWRPGHLTA